ncbi:DUF885 domain-containing protein [Shewanella gelidii]
MLNRFCIACILLSLTACMNTTAPQVKSESANRQLNQIIEQAWAITLEESPSLSYALGNNQAGNQLPDLAPLTLKKAADKKRDLLSRLKRLPLAPLSTQERMNAELLQYQLQNQIDKYDFHRHYVPLSAESGFHAEISRIAKSKFHNQQDYQNYLDKLAALPTYFAQQTYWLKQGLKHHITPPQVVLDGFDASIEAFITPAEQSIYFTPFHNMPTHITNAKQLKQQAINIIQNDVVPLYQDFLLFMRDQYIPNASRSIAASDLPKGKQFYANRVAHYTTLAMTADEVHQLGLKEVARIKKEMNSIIEQFAFKGSFADFLHDLRTDPKFYPKTELELLKEASFIAKKADAMLPKYFSRLPRMPYGIAPVPAEIAPKYTTGRYSGSNRDDQAGYYWVNTYALDKRPLYELEALTLHEAVPGHHLQIALNKELEGLPNFRRYSYISAFGEGWGLYSEYLGLEAGFYKDPYSNFGRLTYEMWRAARLVVDTGMHAKGWSRQQAIDYMAGNTALSLHNVTTEIDRYIAWPGQALSYKIGELTIKRLRQDAETRLGDQFDIRKFHDALLGNGSVTLSILEQQIERFIQSQLKSPQDGA